VVLLIRDQRQTGRHSGSSPNSLRTPWCSPCALESWFAVARFRARRAPSKPWDWRIRRCRRNTWTCCGVSMTA
jgi:hypothetical protein